MGNPPLYKYPAGRYVERLVRDGKLLLGTLRCPVLLHRPE